MNIENKIEQMLEEIQNVDCTDRDDMEDLIKVTLEEHNISETDSDYAFKELMSKSKHNYLSNHVEELINQIENSWTEFFDTYNNPAVKMLLNAVRGKKAWELAQDADSVAFTEQTNIDIDNYLSDEGIEDNDDQQYISEKVWGWFE